MNVHYGQDSTSMISSPAYESEDLVDTLVLTVLLQVMYIRYLLDSRYWRNGKAHLVEHKNGIRLTVLTDTSAYVDFRNSLILILGYHALLFDL
jgi:hypothetical protein